MKNLTKVFSFLFAIFMIMSPLTANAANFEEASFESRVQSLSNKYDVDITVKSVASSRSTLTKEQEEAELIHLEERLAAGKVALEENNRQAQAAWDAVVSSGRLDDNNYVDSFNAIQAGSTHTVYYFQNIGSYYPNGTTIRCRITANRVYSNTNKIHIWGSVISTGSNLYSGRGSNWKETDCQTANLDGGRVKKVQVWGDLTEKYTSFFKEYTVTSKGWRIWYEAYCPA